ncbi:hypothetical protein L2744_11305 [Shewanella profunda]|uniref:hypothetical protein n=1 Tax=Shewanella profunda TaxID=254793 RepID=UPI00200DBC8E|nr:hypothetical protein [Shewanella profunda]MCL1090163.1 hypothetical protein [Shewanella profunda]
MFSWGNLATKQLLVGIVCHAIALGLLAYGVYEFYWQELVLPELIRSIAVAVLLIGMGLAPKLFFMSVSQIVSQTENTAVKSKVQAYVFNLGIFLLICSFLMEWLYP